MPSELEVARNRIVGRRTGNVPVVRVRVQHGSGWLAAARFILGMSHQTSTTPERRVAGRRSECLELSAATGGLVRLQVRTGNEPSPTRNRYDRLTCRA